MMGPHCHGHRSGDHRPSARRPGGPAGRRFRSDGTVRPHSPTGAGSGRRMRNDHASPPAAGRDEHRRPEPGVEAPRGRRRPRRLIPASPGITATDEQPGGPRDGVVDPGRDAGDRSGAEASTVAVSGATVSVSPGPKTRTAGSTSRHVARVRPDAAQQEQAGRADQRSDASSAAAARSVRASAPARAESSEHDRRDRQQRRAGGERRRTRRRPAAAAPGAGRRRRAPRRPAASTTFAAVNWRSSEQLRRHAADAATRRSTATNAGERRRTPTASTASGTGGRTAPAPQAVSE